MTSPRQTEVAPLTDAEIAKLEDEFRRYGSIFVRDRRVIDILRAHAAGTQTPLSRGERTGQRWPKTGDNETTASLIARLRAGDIHDDDREPIADRLQSLRSDVERLRAKIEEETELFGELADKNSTLRTQLTEAQEEIEQLKEALPRLVDLTWGRAMEDGSVPSSKIVAELTQAAALSQTKAGEVGK